MVAKHHATNSNKKFMELYHKLETDTQQKKNHAVLLQCNMAACSGNYC
jgi:hypothetical protein